MSHALFALGATLALGGAFVGVRMLGYAIHDTVKHAPAGWARLMWIATGCCAVAVAIGLILMKFFPAPPHAPVP